MFIISALAFGLLQNGVSGPSTEAGTYVAEAAIFAAPIGLLMCTVAGIRALVRRYKASAQVQKKPPFSA